jgi:hypothetical protein
MRTAKDRDTMLGKAIVKTLQKECVTAHPEAEELAALIDGNLNPDKRAGIMEHLASCDRCYEVFSMSSEMVKEQQGVRRIADFKIPLTLVAGILIAVGLFFAYKGLYFPSPEVVALKEAPRLSVPAELKAPPASSIASVKEKKNEETKPQENNLKEKPAPVYYAKVEVNDAVGEFLNDTPEDIVTDKKQIGELVAMLVRDDRTIGRYDISEVRIEHGETIMRSARSSAGKAEIRIKNSVLTIRLVD